MLKVAIHRHNFPNSFAKKKKNLNNLSNFFVTVYAAIPGMAELGMVWMGDVMVPTDPSHELLLDPRHTENFFSAGAHPFGADIRSHQIAPTTTMVRYMAPTFINDCSEPEEPGETMDSQDLQNVCLFFIKKKKYITSTYAIKRIKMWSDKISRYALNNHRVIVYEPMFFYGIFFSFFRITIRSRRVKR